MHAHFLSRLLIVTVAASAFAAVADGDEWRKCTASDARDCDELAPGQVAIISASDGRFVCAAGAAPFTSPRCSSACQFSILKPIHMIHDPQEGSGNYFICLKTEEGVFLSMQANSNASPQQASCSSNHVLEVIDLDGYGTVALRSANGFYVQAEPGGSVQMVQLSGAVTLLQTFLIDEGHVLSHERRLRQNGFTVLHEVINAHETAEVKEILELTEQVAGRVELHNGIPQQVRVPNILAHHHVFSELLLHPAVLAIVQRLLHNDFRCATWSSNTLLPRMTTPALGWHVDYPYHDINPPWPQDTLSVQVLWLLDNFTEHNGATMFLPESHTWLRQPEYDFSTPQNAQKLLAPAGSVLIAHGAWWHRQTPNISPVSRSALLASFCRAFVVPKADMEGQLIEMQEGALTDRLTAFQQDRLRYLLLGQHKRGLRNIHA